MLKFASDFAFKNSSDYRDIDPRYGTLEDWDRLLEGVHDRGMKLMSVMLLDLSVLRPYAPLRMDLVVNHTSDEVGRHHSLVIFV